MLHLVTDGTHGALDPAREAGCKVVHLGRTKHRNRNNVKGLIPFDAVIQGLSMHMNKAERKGSTREKVHQAIYWLTGYDGHGVHGELDRRTVFRTFFAEASAPPDMSENQC